MTPLVDSTLIVSGAKNPGFLALASEEELKELQGALNIEVEVSVFWRR